jgi:hypothetical protein
MDVEEFPKWFPSGPIHAIEEESKFFLVGERFEALTSAAEVRELAVTTLGEFAAVVRLLWSSLHTPQVGAVTREDERGNRSSLVLLAAGVQGRSKVSAVLVHSGRPRDADAQTQAQQIQAVARSRPRLGVALLVWAATERTWPRLYRVLEEIEQDLGVKVDKKGLCTAAERERFTRSANTAEIAGHEARHAGGRFAPPDRPMVLSEAAAFVGRLLETALRGYLVPPSS